MNFNGEFEVCVAKFGVATRDGRALKRGGSWVYNIPAPVMHRDQVGAHSTLVGSIEEWAVTEGVRGRDNGKLWARGHALPSIADALNKGILALGVDILNGSTTVMDGVLVFTSGTFTSAYVIKADQWGWR